MDIGRALYEKPPDEKKLAAFGLRLSDYPDKLFEVWEEHADAYISFVELSTQWQVAGMGGATGLNYASILPALDRMHRGKTEEERDAIFAGIRLIERGALEEMGKAAEEARKK